VIRTVRPKLSCACCPRIVQEPAPHRPIDRGSRRSRAAGACSGREVCGPSSALPAVGGLCARRRRSRPLDHGRLGWRREPDAAASG
jgi:hypothetical protein